MYYYCAVCSVQYKFAVCSVISWLLGGQEVTFGRGLGRDCIIDAISTVSDGISTSQAHLPVPVCQCARLGTEDLDTAREQQEEERSS